MKNLLSGLLLLSFMNLFAQQTEPKLQKVNYNELSSIVDQNDGVLYVVNFFATWCKPCIEEIPVLMEVNSKHSIGSNFKMILVSFDHRNYLNTKLKKFIEKHGIFTDVYLMDDEKPLMDLIPEIEPNWNGAIPSTVFYKNGKKLFFKQGSLTQFELEDLVDDFL